MCNYFKMLRNIMLMLDSASILMQQYQGLMARLPPPTPAAVTPLATAAAAAAEGAATVEPAATTPTTESSSTAYDKPSTSRAAAAAVAVNQAMPQEAHQISVSKSVPLTNVAETVTIEDLGAEEDDLLPSTDAASLDVEIEDNSELSELRKRRLKFLEERNKSPTSSDVTD